MEHMKVYEKILERRLRRTTEIDNCQLGFHQGRSQLAATIIMNQLQEEFSQRKKDELYHIFVDIEKTFNWVPRGVPGWTLRKQKVPKRLPAVMAFHVGTKSEVKTAAIKLRK